MNGVDAFYLGKKWQMWNYSEHVFFLAPFSHFGNPLPHNHRTSTLISNALYACRENIGMHVVSIKIITKYYIKLTIKDMQVSFSWECKV